MNKNHLSAWEQEEYLLNERTPEMMRHLTVCAECQDAVQRLEDGIGTYRRAAVEWSAECLATRPHRLQVLSLRDRPAMLWRWALAAMVPLVLLWSLLPLFHSRPQPSRPAATISDDALLDQVDEQLSVAVPDSMESLTHLVSTQSNASGAATHALRSKPIVQDN